MTDGDWVRDAACQHEPPDLFFPVSHPHGGSTSTRPAKAVCARCPVRQECLAYALTFDARGIWGGTTETEREQLRPRRLPGRPSSDPPHGTEARYKAHQRAGETCLTCREGHRMYIARRRQAS